MKDKRKSSITEGKTKEVVFIRRRRKKKKKGIPEQKTEKMEGRKSQRNKK